MTMFDELIDLLDLVGCRDCAWGHGWDHPCNDDSCEACRARVLYARMVEARDRVSPQDDAVRTR